ncbi:hypothetical protein IGI04_007494, partial [Brassica rapa subsp. trilocularis]
IGSVNSQLHQRFTVDTERTRERARCHLKRLDSSFSDHLSDRQIDVRCVYDQPGDEATLVKQIVSDGILPEYYIDLISESFGVACWSRQGQFGVSSGFFRTRGKGVQRRLDLRCYWCGRAVQRLLYHGRYLRGRGYRDILY